MKNLVLGASGQIGHALTKRLIHDCQEVVGTYCSHNLYSDLPCRIFKADVSDQTSVNNIISDYVPDVIFVPAGYTHVDGCEKEPKSKLINVNGINHITKAARNIKHKSPLIVIFSSDYVFDGTGGPYSEEDIPNPISEYGKQKLLAEHLLATSYNNFCIVRTNWVFGPDPQEKNFVVRLINNLKDGQAATVPFDEWGTPTYTVDIAEATIKLIKYFGLQRSRTNRIVNIAGGKWVNKYEFSLSICDVFGLDRRLVTGVKSSELKRPAARPLLSGLKVGKIEELIGQRMQHYEDALMKYKKLLSYT